MSLLDEVGPSQFEHTAHMIQAGCMQKVLMLFADLGWTEDKARRLQSKEYEIRFVRSLPSDPAVQLTEHVGETFPEPLRGAHIALRVLHPEAAADSIVGYAHYRGWHHANSEPANKECTKFWVSIPEIMAFKIELVPPST